MADRSALTKVCCLGVLLLAGCRAQTLNVSDTDLLNFAMNLECLEAEYYSTAINGYGLNSSTLGNGPSAVGGLKANLSPELIQIATELANDEINHVRPFVNQSTDNCTKGFTRMAGGCLGPLVISLQLPARPSLWCGARQLQRLYLEDKSALSYCLTASRCMQVTDLRAQLGGAAVPCPTMDIGNSFTTIASKALGVYGFFPYNTDVNFLLGELSDAPPALLQCSLEPLLDCTRRLLNATAISST